MTSARWTDGAELAADEVKAPPPPIPFIPPIVRGVQLVHLSLRQVLDTTEFRTVLVRVGAWAFEWTPSCLQRSRPRVHRAADVHVGELLLREH
jgi:hypothetical protein